MRKILVPLVLVLLVLAGSWLVLGTEAPRQVDGAGAAGSRAPTVAVAADRRSPDGEPAAEPRRARSKAEREALRRRIVEALENRERAAVGGEVEVAGDAEDAPDARKKRAARAEAEDAAPTPGALIDRSGNHGYLMKVMNEELMPLVDECYELARGTRPELAGMLVLDVEILGDAEIGGVVESIAAGSNNELTDPALNECVRESLLSTTLPAPPQGGRDAISLSLRLSPDEAE